MNRGQHQERIKAGRRMQPVWAAAALLGMLLGSSCGSGPVSGVRGTPDGGAGADGSVDQVKPADGGTPDAGPTGEINASGSDVAVADALDAATTETGAPGPEVSDVPAADVTGAPEISAEAGADGIPPDESDSAAEVPAAADTGAPDSADAPSGSDVAGEVALDTVIHEDEVGNMPGPVAACRQLTATLCARDAQCAGQTATPAALALCDQRGQVVLGCDRATSSLFPACLQDTAALGCTALFTPDGLILPPSCDAPLNIPLSTAQNQCLALVDAFCRRAVGCDNGTDADVTNCIQFELDRDLPCQLAIDVTPNYSVCLTQIQTVACPQLLAGGALPACSDAVVLTP
jgi:hypothetical protein